MPSGGAHGGPQYNPANISATGGAGQSGAQATRYIPDMKSLGSTGVETMAQQNAAPMFRAPSLEQGINPVKVTELTAPTEFPDQPVTDGSITGPGANSIPGLPTVQDNNLDTQRLREYLPALEHAASLPNASEAFRNYVRLARAKVSGD